MCQEILFILVGYFQDTELTIHIHLCMHQLTQSDIVLMDMTDDVLLLKFVALFRNIISMIHVPIPTHCMPLLCNTSHSLITPD